MKLPSSILALLIISPIVLSCAGVVPALSALNEPQPITLKPVTGRSLGLPKSWMNGLPAPDTCWKIDSSMQLIEMSCHTSGVHVYKQTAGTLVEFRHTSIMWKWNRPRTFQDGTPIPRDANVTYSISVFTPGKWINGKSFGIEVTGIADNQYTTGDVPFGDRVCATVEATVDDRIVGQPSNPACRTMPETVSRPSLSSEPIP
jgi:hypothetical protein